MTRRHRLVALSLAALLLAAGAQTSWAGTAATTTPAEAEAIGREAYRYGLPLLEFLRVRRENTSVRAPDGRGNAPVNRFSNARRFAGPENRTVVAPNVDTLYSIAQLDLGRGPIVLRHPDLGRRYVVFQLLDPYTNTVGYVGTRVTGRKAGRFAISWTKRPGRVRGMKVIRSEYRRLWVIGRTLASTAADQRRARALMRRYALIPLRRLAEGPIDYPRRRPGKPREATTPQGLAFLESLGRAMERNPPPARDRPILRRLAALGIGPGTSPARAGLAQPVVDALVAGVRAEAATLPTATRGYVLEQARASGGWFISPPRIGDYGTDYLLRARIAVVGLGANTREEATYPAAVTDAAGNLLDGSRPYRLTFRRGQAPPNRAFWSLTMYDLDGYLVANANKRYAVGDSHPPLRRRADGSIVIAIQRSRPADRTVNWLPPPAAGPFRLNLRIYWPRRSVLTGAWKPPPLEGG